MSPNAEFIRPATDQNRVASPQRGAHLSCRRGVIITGMQKHTSRAEGMTKLQAERLSILLVQSTRCDALTRARSCMRCMREFISSRTNSCSVLHHSFGEVP